MRLLPASRRARRVLAVLAVVFVVFVGATLRLFVFPATNAPAHADAIVVLGGSGSPTEREGFALIAKGDAPLVFFSLRPNQKCHPFTAYIPQKVKGSCFYANPQTTQGEARAIAHLARVDHLSRIIVVAPTSQVTRARLRITRCYPGQLLMDGVRSGDIWQWAYAVAYEWGATVKALVWQRGC